MEGRKEGRKEGSKQASKQASKQRRKQGGRDRGTVHSVNPHKHGPGSSRASMSPMAPMAPTRHTSNTIALVCLASCTGAASRHKIKRRVGPSGSIYILASGTTRLLPRPPAPPHKSAGLWKEHKTRKVDGQLGYNNHYVDLHTINFRFHIWTAKETYLQKKANYFLFFFIFLRFCDFVANC